ncbi:MAG: 23S rRNA (adenine(2030)-N(6))-methyltransferase RlmJ [Acidimicrobiia bacterium]|nr:23S rRNA (adenine(2030)-N(6))-methyltransferase RlmJ [Acidimicrobiia bacterium]
MTNRHFGRISEVWKDLLLAEVLAIEQPRALLDTHAGDALYPVVDDPERSYGVMAFNDLVGGHPLLRDSAYASVLASVRTDSTLDGIPGGPLVAMEVLGTDAEYVFCDRDPDSASNIRDVAAARGVRSAQVLTADGMGSVHAALADRDDASVVVFIDPFDHYAVGPSGLSALDVAREAANAGAVLVYWYGYNRIDERHWIVEELAPRDAGVEWWCGDVMISAEDADMASGDLGEASSPGTGSGVMCINASAATIERCTELGTALSAPRSAIDPCHRAARERSTS